MFCDRNRVHIADNAQRDGPRIQRRQIHRIIANPMARHDFQPGCFGHAGRTQRLGADYNAIGLVKPGLIRGFGDLLDMGEGDARGGLKQCQTRRVQFARNQDKGHQ